MKRWLRAFLHGMAYITIWPQARPVRTPYTGRDPAKADAEAIAGDWRAVGGDLRAAAAKLKRDADRQ